jgi:hypothetical protein
LVCGVVLALADLQKGVNKYLHLFTENILVRTTIVLKKFVFRTCAFNNGMPVDPRHVGVTIDAVTDVIYSMDSYLMHVAGV